MQHPSGALRCSQDFLWTVCQPFIEQMLAALQSAIETQLEGGENFQGAASRDVRKNASGASMNNSIFMQRGKSDPFCSLFNRSPTAAGRWQALGKGTNTAESLKEEAVISADMDAEVRPSASRTWQMGGLGMQDAGGEAGVRSMPQKIQTRPSPARRELQLPMDTTLPESDSEQSNVEEGELDETQPQYLAWSETQQYHAPGSGSSPLLGRVGPDGKRWADHRPSPTSSPLTQEMVPVQEDSVMDEARVADAAQVEESGQPPEAMVCRHWKTKGWCRLEAACKFLHPEEQRGSAAPVPTTRPDPSAASSTGQAGQPAQKKSSRSSRRSGRNRHGASHAGSTAAGNSGGAGATAQRASTTQALPAGAIS